jgi:hypothetical protein
MNEKLLANFLARVERIGAPAAARELVRMYTDAAFADRCGAAKFVGTLLGHDLVDVMSSVPGDLESECTACRRTLCVPKKRPGIMGHAVEVPCPGETSSVGTERPRRS